MMRLPATTEDDARRRVEAAIETIGSLALNLRTIRRGGFPPEAKHRIREILRLCAETQDVLERLREIR